jgi:RNA polymerase sigma-70 factor (ECF subfamily)
MLKRTNEQWMDDLRVQGAKRDLALADLREVILNGLPYALNSWLATSDPRYSPLADEVAQETLLRVIARLDTFEGRSQFTTWVNKIAVRIALTELRRKRWENYSLEEMVEGEEDRGHARLILDRQAASPEEIVEGADLLLRLQKIIMEEIGEKQRQAMMAVVIQEAPLEEVARRMGTNRNALYKLMHDARLRLKQRLAQEGLTPQDVLAAFESK